MLAAQNPLRAWLGSLQGEPTALQVLMNPCVCRLTQPQGVQMAELPLPPSLGAALLAGAETGCAREVAAVAALLSVRSVWVNRRGEEALLDEEKARQAASCMLR